jgi:hypothetical protein
MVPTMIRCTIHCCKQSSGGGAVIMTTIRNTDKSTSRAVWRRRSWDGREGKDNITTCTDDGIGQTESTVTVQCNSGCASGRVSR